MDAPDIFSAEDLISNPASFSSFALPVRLGVIGDPVAHSRSPVFHNAALKACGIPAQYAKLHIPPERFAEAVRALLQQLSASGKVELAKRIGQAKAKQDEAEAQRLMAEVAQLKVPLLAEVGVGPNWEQAH